MTPNRRSTIAMLAAASALGAPAMAQTRKPITTDDVVMGRVDAPIIMTEYASVACPVCAAFHIEVFPQLKRKYIDTGQMKFISREILIHNPTLAAQGYLIARCAGEDQYFQAIDGLYRNQEDMDKNGKVREGLTRVANSVGMSGLQMEDCLADRAALTELNARVQRNVQTGRVQRTPTFVINGARIEGYRSLEQMDQIIGAVKTAIGLP